MPDTKIEWAEKVWNPVTGCTPVSEGCANCYAKRQAKRLHGMGQGKYWNEFCPTFHPSALSEPLSWKKPVLIFVPSMGDLFHDLISDHQIDSVVSVINECSWHKFMLLTKRIKRAREWLPQFLSPLPNLALGVSCENQARLEERLNDLKHCPAAYRFLSLEPLLGPISLASADWDWHEYIDLVIVGGESGPGARVMDPNWVRDIRDDCIYLDMPFCFKQWGGVNKKKLGRMLDGKIHDGKIAWK